MARSFASNSTVVWVFVYSVCALLVGYGLLISGRLLLGFIAATMFVSTMLLFQIANALAPTADG